MKKTTLEDYYIEFLSPEEQKIAPKGFEVVGDIAIFEIPKELEYKEKEIGESVLKVNPSIKTVLRKEGTHGGEFRTQKLVFVAGEDKKETIHLENGVKIKLNPETVYYSSRLSTERGNLTENIKPDTKIMVLFSGCGPYTFTALKKMPNIARIDSIELNPEGHKYALENLELNKNILKKSKTYIKLLEFLKENKLRINEKELIKNLNSLRIHIINGDVRKEIKKLILPIRDDYMELYDNILFEKEPIECYKKLNELGINSTIYLDFNSIKKPDNYINFLILFADKFKYKLSINENENYSFKTDLEKGYLLNILENIETKKREDVTKYDEIFMPLPTDAISYLADVFQISKQGTIIHMYDFLDDDEFPKKAEENLKDAAKKSNKTIEIIKIRKVGQYSPRKFRICCDFIVK